MTDSDPPRGDLRGIAGSAPNKFPLRLRRHYGSSDRDNFEGGFGEFYDRPEVISRIGEHRRRVLPEPASVEYHYRPFIRLYSDRKNRADRPRGLARVPPPQTREYRRKTKRVIPRASSDIFGLTGDASSQSSSSQNPKPKPRGLRHVTGPESGAATSLENILKKKKRVSLPPHPEPTKISQQQALLSTGLGVSGLQFRSGGGVNSCSSGGGGDTSSSELVSAFDPRVTLVDKALLGRTRARARERVARREREYEARSIAELRWDESLDSSDDEDDEVVDVDEVDEDEK